jgi:dTDP-4-amino-4,6-dideoxy-D-galactose acyltransferase
MSVQFLAWDSHFFGYKTGLLILNANRTLNLRNLIEKNLDYKLLYIRCTPGHAQQEEITQLGGILTDEKITFVQDIPAPPYSYSSNIELYPENEPNEEIIQLGLASGVYSRFKVDKNFKNNEFERLYEMWIKNSTNKTIAKHVLAYQKEKKYIGLLTLGEKNNRADIGILAVDEQYRGMGIGKSLVQKSFELSAEMGYTQLQVVTQKANINACKFYESMGFNIHSIENIYHLWIHV